MILFLDTEFVWQSTYFAKLGVVQAAPSEGGLKLAAKESDFIPFASAAPRHKLVRLIDPLVCDGADFARAVSDPAIVKIFHAGDQDIEYISRWCGARFANVFDTSLAARFCGRIGQVSLQKLIAEIFSAELQKDSTLTDWLKRPLSQKQLAYALDDVAYLDALREALIAQARAAGTLAWMTEAMLEFEEETQVVEPQGNAWKRVKHVQASRFNNGRQLVILRELAETRERLAIAADLPRGWVMDDSELVAACLKPSAFSWTKAAKDIPNGLAPELEAAFARALEMPLENMPRLAVPPPLVPKSKIERVRDAVAGCALRHGIDPLLVGARSHCTDYAADPSDPTHKFNRGWRRELLAGAL